MSELYDKINLILNEKINKITPENIKEGVTIFNITGNLIEGPNTADATATISDILQNKTAYVNGVKITGNIPNNGTLNYNPTENVQNIPAGYTTGR